jgi:hypothetical protein
MRFVFVPCLLQMLLQLQFSIPAPLAHGAQLPGGRRAGSQNVADRFAGRRPHGARFLVLAHNRMVPRLRDPGQGLQAFCRKERGASRPVRAPVAGPGAGTPVWRVS